MMGANFLVLFILGVLSSSIANAIPIENESTTTTTEISSFDDDSFDNFYAHEERLPADGEIVKSSLSSALQTYYDIWQLSTVAMVVELVGAKRELIEYLDEYVYSMTVTIGETNCTRGTTETNCQVTGEDHK